MIDERSMKQEDMLSKASPPSTAAFHAFLREGHLLSEEDERGVKEKKYDDLNDRQDDENKSSDAEEIGEDGIDFIQALSDRGDAAE